MFEGAPQAYTGMLESHNRQASRDVREASADIRELAADLSRVKKTAWAWQHRAEALEAELAEARAVLQARDEADAAQVAAWRQEHPVSHMHDFVGRWRDGEGMRRNAAIWIAAFDVSARRLGIANPEAHRIS